MAGPRIGKMMGRIPVLLGDKVQTCPYCRGEIPDEAVKCRHCGEWVDESGEPESRDLAETLSQGVRDYVRLRIIATVVGAALFLLVLLFFVLPRFSHAPDQVSPQQGMPTPTLCPDNLHC